MPGVAENNAVGAGGTATGGAAGEVGPTACFRGDFDPPPQPASRIKGNKNLSLTFLLARLVLPALMWNPGSANATNAQWRALHFILKKVKQAHEGGGGKSTLGKKYCHPETLTIGETPYSMAARATAGLCGHLTQSVSLHSRRGAQNSHQG